MAPRQSECDHQQESLVSLVQSYTSFHDQIQSCQMLKNDIETDVSDQCGKLADADLGTYPLECLEMLQIDLTQLENAGDLPDDHQDYEPTLGCPACLRLLRLCSDHSVGNYDCHI